MTNVDYILSLSLQEMYGKQIPDWAVHNSPTNYPYKVKIWTLMGLDALYNLK